MSGEKFQQSYDGPALRYKVKFRGSKGAVKKMKKLLGELEKIRPKKEQEGC